MEFIETPIFTKEVRRRLDESEYRALQLALLLRPEQGKVLPGSGGLRKLRWGLQGRGKRGALRLIYDWDTNTERSYMLFLYSKSRQGDLTREELK